MSDGATLAADAARIDLAGQPLLTRLSVNTDAERVALLGDWSALFRLLSSEAELTAGRLQVGGANVPQGVVAGVVGVMRLDPLLPDRWSAEQLLAQSAELAGIAAKSAKKVASQLLEQLGLLGLATRRLAQLALAERRALLVAHGSLTSPRVLCLEQPFAGLDTPAERAVLAVIERASAGRRLIIALGESQTPAARQLLQTCSEHLRIAAGVVVTEAAAIPVPARVTATVCRNHQAFAAALAARGLNAHPTHEVGMLSLLTAPSAGPCWRYLVELPENSTAAILDAALETGASLVELLPITTA